MLLQKENQMLKKKCGFYEKNLKRQFECNENGVEFKIKMDEEYYRVDNKNRGGVVGNFTYLTIFMIVL